MRDENRLPAFVARPRSKIKFRRKTRVSSGRPATPSIEGIEFDPGSYPRLSPESVITDPPAFSPRSALVGEGGSVRVAPKRNQEEEERALHRSRRVHCSSEPGEAARRREKESERQSPLCEGANWKNDSLVVILP